MKKYKFLAIVLVALVSCKNIKRNKDNELTKSEVLQDLLLSYNQKIIHAAKIKSFEVIRDLYDGESFLMADYNSIIVNQNNIKIYYDTIFARQNIKEYHRQTIDILEFKNRIIEIGLFTKVFENSEKVNGKYLNVWKKDAEGKLKLRAESLGYLQPIEDPTILIVPKAATATNAMSNMITIPRELEAYIALGKNNVIARIPEKTADAYTEDAMYLPFADTIKTGKSVLVDHYKLYYHNPAKIDSLELMTYAYDKVENGYIKYGGFYVEWTVPGFTGSTAGNGISYWRREKDNSLRIHRQIGLHTYK
ncbi:hypothetical protein [Aquimarina sp. SS2-1]|uniref:hypothetical protein n=1 Tax=Aquimarina besae TaxID=3342247 RepID=UPI0036717FAB